MNERPALPAFAPVAEACPILGISRTRLYDHLVPLDGDILVQLGGRTLVDIPRAVALIEAMPRGPRKPNGGGGKGESVGPERCQLGGGGHDHQTMIFVFATVPHLRSLQSAVRGRAQRRRYMSSFPVARRWPGAARGAGGGPHWADSCPPKGRSGTAGVDVKRTFWIAAADVVVGGSSHYSGSPAWRSAPAIFSR